MGYPTCYYRTFAIGRASSALRDAYTICREYMDKTIGPVKLSSTTADIVKDWPTTHECGTARIEEELVVTATGCEVITKFPAEELLVAGQRYYTVGGALNTTREAQSHLNTSTFNHIGNGK